jgi:cell wall-associated protease
MTFKRFTVMAACVALGTSLMAQSAKAPENWFVLDQTKDNVNGTGANEAIARMKAKGKKGQTVIVAVLDSGVEVDHPDLKDVMWVNPGEIAGNGKDDDGNGYIDDIHGWNFIGGKDGRNVDHDSYEITREYARLTKRFKGTDPKNLYGDAKKEYEYYTGIKEAYESKRTELEDQKKQVDEFFGKIDDAFVRVQKATGLKVITADDLGKVQAGSNEELAAAVTTLQKVFAQGITQESLPEQKEEASKYFSGGLNYGYNTEFNPREIVGDRYDDLTDRNYGNNDYEGPDAFHGTHVAGIIAAKRGNGAGIDGVADNVRIMTVRCVPDGDERDKDVANAIYYAVDNGASIINMSFGKGYSPNKAYVDAAMKYAADHDVLLVHAAGNDSENNDTDPNFPNDMYSAPVKAGLFKKEKNVSTWMEIGALSFKKDDRRVANFSNYGKKNVDLFSPGVQIYSTVPDAKYGNAQGTSMAAPAAAGVAAILRSYYPELSATQVKEVMETSVIKQDGEVYKPGTTEKVKFSELCVSGGTVSAPAAVEAAEKVKAKKNKKAIWREAGMGKAVKLKKEKQSRV